MGGECRGSSHCTLCFIPCTPAQHRDPYPNVGHFGSQLVGSHARGPGCVLSPPALLGACRPLDRAADTPDNGHKALANYVPSFSTPRRLAPGRLRTPTLALANWVPSYYNQSPCSWSQSVLRQSSCELRSQLFPSRRPAPGWTLIFSPCVATWTLHRKMKLLRTGFPAYTPRRCAPGRERLQAWPPLAPCRRSSCDFSPCYRSSCELGSQLPPPGAAPLVGNGSKRGHLWTPRSPYDCGPSYRPQAGAFGALVATSTSRYLPLRTRRYTNKIIKVKRPKR